MRWMLCCCSLTMYLWQVGIPTNSVLYMLMSLYCILIPRLLFVKHLKSYRGLSSGRAVLLLGPSKSKSRKKKNMNLLAALCEAINQAEGESEGWLSVSHRQSCWAQLSSLLFLTTAIQNLILTTYICDKDSCYTQPSKSSCKWLC